MGLEKHLAEAIVVAGISLASIALNPNFEAKDFVKPHRFVQKMDYGREYPASGRIYLFSGIALAASSAAIGYQLLRKD